ncbi:vacuolar sorting protein 39 domain 2-domain-containing protein [Mycotypha africana]|uniref:vacuolar sorting protein 39 domain 2-domain-containing protein n=1 Tax=Mycotypha africana TaxID=64632 RepID=UPI0023005C1F|nr:vacuolar sorting protein 39 domain 2-domain-containing protein [Mycotypha africana]KAI8973310.1 vacuolar sorting protein 39 domain 2-domain-containing protein [Mycotypha africana]
MVEMTPEEQIPVLTTRLAVSVRKKLLVYIWKDTEFYETKELNTPDRVKTMAWVGSTKICLGFSAEYALMDVEEGQFTELFASTGVNDNGPMSTLNSLYNMSIGTRGGKPMITKIPNNEMLLAKDYVSIFLGLDGTPTRKVGIEWSGIPEQIGYSYPYVIAILPKHVEVRNIQTLSLVQQIDLVNIKFLNQGKLVYIASTSQVYRLTPYSFSTQIDQLVEKQEYQEAISLLDQINEVLVDNKEAKSNSIRTAYAHDLFRCGEYDKALSTFQELDTPPAEVVSLYPEMIAGALAKKPDAPYGDNEGGTTDRTMEPPKKQQNTSLMTSHSQHSKKKESVPLTDLNLREAVSYLIRYLTDKRQKLAKRLNSDSSQSLSTMASVRSSTLNEEELLQQSTLVDTTLLKCYMMTNDALVGPLLRVQNHCDVEECEHILKNKKLVSLSLRLGKQPEGPMRGIMPTIRYLQKLGIHQFELVLKYSRWVLEKDPKQGLEIFIDDLAETGTLPREKVLRHLESVSGDLAIEYLEFIIEELRDESPEFHNKLIIAYLNEIIANKELKSRLLTFLTESSFYKAEKILSRLPIDDLFEERAILLSRIGQHDQALDIYVYKLKNYTMAEEYCTKVYYKDPVKGEQMYLTLLKVYLQPAHNQEPLIEPALKLLSHRGSHIDASQVLSILPDNTKLHGLFSFLEKYIRETNKRRNMDMIVKNLWKAEQIQVEEQLMYYRSRAVKITEDRMCPQCNKRIGNSVFAVFPNGVVVHYSCKEKIEQAQWKLS